MEEIYMSESGEHPEHQPTPELESGQELYLAVANLCGDTLLRSGLPIDAPVRSFAFMIELKTDNRPILTHGLTIERNSERPFRYEIQLKSEDNITGRFVTTAVSITEDYEVNTINSSHLESKEEQIDYLIKSIPNFKDTEAKLTISLPAVKDETQSE